MHTIIRYSNCILLYAWIIYIITDVTIGFFNTSFSVLESRGRPNIQVGVIDGSLQIELVIRYSITDLSVSNSSSGELHVTT